MGILPSIIWLLFYLRKDKNPEPNRLVVLVFIMGALIAYPTAFLELWISDIGDFITSEFFKNIFFIFVAGALVEETMKYLAVRWSVLRNPEFNEPVDAMIYMIIAALGFAAVENTLTLFKFSNGIFNKALSIGGIRFLGATFLHTLASGTLGYYLALSYFKRPSQDENRWKLIPYKGIAIATILHGLYNYIVFLLDVKNGNDFLLYLLISYLVVLGIILSFGFWKIKKLKLKNASE